MSDKRFNYCLYANIPGDLIDKIQEAREKIQEKYSNSQKYKVTETPHITIVYGPSISETETEIDKFDKEAINSLYAGFLDTFSNCLLASDEITTIEVVSKIKDLALAFSSTASSTSDSIEKTVKKIAERPKQKTIPNLIQYLGVSHFINNDQIIIKLELKSTLLDRMKNHVGSNVPEMMIRRMKKYAEFEQSDKIDRTSDIPAIRWAHITLCSLKRETSFEDVIKIEDEFRNMLYSFPSSFSPTSISLVSAKTDTEIKLF